MTRRSKVKGLCYDEVFAVIISRMGSTCTIWNPGGLCGTGQKSKISQANAGGWFQVGWLLPR